jgi:hypothetical protein
VLAAALAVGHAVAPDSDMGVLSGLAVVLWWGLSPVTDDGVPVTALPAAAALVTAHVAAVLVDYGPASRTPDARLLRAWVTRGALAAAAALPVWLVAALADGHEVVGVWEVGVAALAAAALVAALAVRGWPARPAGPAPSGRSRPAA